VICSQRVLLVWDTPYHPSYYFPLDDVAAGVATFSPMGDAQLPRDYVHVQWGAVDRWYEEGEEVYGHPRDPYVRVEVLDTDRHVRVEVAGQVVAESRRVRVVFETRMPARYYLPPDDVHFEFLEISGGTSPCPYKGAAARWDVVIGDLRRSGAAWTYSTPVTAAAKLGGLWCFDADQVDVVVDGEVQGGTVSTPDAAIPDPSTTPGHVEVSPKRVRSTLGGRTVVDSRNARWVWEDRNFPEYFFPRGDVAADVLVANGHTSDHALLGQATHFDVVGGGRRVVDGAWTYLESAVEEVNGLIRFDWTAMDRWLEESEEVHVDPRNPYARLDALESGRHVTVEIDGIVVADTVRAKFLFETRVVTRYYIPHDDVRFDLLRPSDRTSRCPFKGIARYWSVHVNGVEQSALVWSYPAPLPEVAAIAGHVCFYNKRVDITIDGVRQPRR